MTNTKDTPVNIADFRSCRRGYMRGDGTCQLLPIEGKTGERDYCLKEGCNRGLYNPRF